MHILDSEISCGIQQLVDVSCEEDDWGWDDEEDGEEPNLETEYRDAMRDVQGTIVIASLTTKQKKEIQLLERHGFRRVGRPRRNPNSGNRIILFVKNVTKTRR